MFFVWCEHWSVTLRLRVFENMMLRKIFVPKDDKVRGEWERLT